MKPGGGVLALEPSVWHHAIMAARIHPLPPHELALVISRLEPAGLWLFGSQVGRASLGPGDIDLGWLAGRTVQSQERFQLQEDAAAALGREVDLVLLDDASPILVRQVLVKGVLLHAGAPSAVALFIADSVTRYADLIRVRRPMEDAMLRRIAHAGS